MLTLQLRPCYKIVYPGLKRRLLASIAPSERGDTSDVLDLEAARTDSYAPRQVNGEVTSGVLEDTRFDEAIHATTVDIRAGTSTNLNPWPGDVVVSGRTSNSSSNSITFLTPRRNSFAREGVKASDFPGRNFSKRIGIGRGRTL